jgi:hypothetical protein
MDFSTQECAWQNFTLTLLGRKIIGLRGFEFKKSIEKEHLYGAGSEPLDIQEGNKKYEGNIKLLKYEVDLLNDAAINAGFEDITEVPHILISASGIYQKNITDKKRYVTGAGIAFTELPIGFEQNAKMTEVTLPFIAMKISNLSKAPGA